MERKDRIDLLGAVILLVIMMMLGLNQVAVKLVNEGLAPMFQAGLRSLAAAPIVLAYTLFRGKTIDVSAPILIPGMLCGACFATEFVILFQAIEYTTVSRASVFFYTMPFWVALAAHFLIPGEQLTKLKITGLVLACAGVAIALSNNSAPAGPNSLLGDLMSLVAASLWAAIAIIARTTRFSTIAPEVQLLYQVVVSAMILMPVILLFGETFRQPTLFHWTIFAMQVVFVVCMGFLAWFWVLSVYPASDMASFSFLAPVFGVLFGWLVLGEQLGWTILAALALVGTGIVLVNRKPKFP